MKTIRFLSEALSGAKVIGDPATVVSNITDDSRTAGAGSLFVALRGERFDGHDFIEGVIEQGAAALLVDQGWDPGALGVGIPIIQVEDTRAVLGDLGRAFFDAPSDKMRVIGITGTNGKTTSTYLLEALFTEAGMVTGVIGTVEYRWRDRREAAPNTTPDGLVLQRILRAMLDDGVEVVILEVSSHGLASGRVDGVSFDAGVFTNFSQDHLDFHETMDAYKEAKRRLFVDYLPLSRLVGEKKSFGVFNMQDPVGSEFARAAAERGVPVWTHGRGARADVDYRAEILEESVGGITFRVRAFDDEFPIHSPMPGRFNVENLLGAIVVAHRLGISIEVIQRGLRAFRGVPGRLESVQVEGREGPAVFVDYAHTPDALERVLLTLRTVQKGRLFVVFGCGGERDRGKRPLMGAVAARNADHVVLTSDNPRRERPSKILDEIEAGVVKILETDEGESTGWDRREDRGEAIQQAIGRAGADDIVLIAGKGHETYQEIEGIRYPFDDRLQAAKALRVGRKE